MWGSLHKYASKVGESQPLFANNDSQSPILPLTNYFTNFAKDRSYSMNEVPGQNQPSLGRFDHDAGREIKNEEDF